MKIPYRSRQYVWAAGAPISVDLSFLDAALAAYKAPVITALTLRVVMNVDTGAGGGPGHALLRLFDKIVLSDQSRERINASSRECAIWAQMQMGSAFEDPRFVDANENNVDVEMLIPLLPPSEDKEARKEDNYLETAAIRNGRLDLYLKNATALGGATEFTVLNSGTIELLAEIENDPAGNPESKSPVCLRSFRLQNAEDFFQINGVLKHLGYWAGPTDETAGTTLAAQNISSNTLQFNSIPNSFFAEAYRRSSHPHKQIESLALAGGEDVVLSEHVVASDYLQSPRFYCPVFQSQRGQKTTDLPIVQTFHLKLDSGTMPTDGAVLVAYYPPRDINQMVTVLKQPSVEALQANIARAGYVKGWRGSRPITSVDPRYRSVLPVKIKG